MYILHYQSGLRVGLDLFHRVSPLAYRDIHPAPKNLDVSDLHQNIGSRARASGVGTGIYATDVGERYIKRRAFCCSRQPNVLSLPHISLTHTTS